MFVDTVKARGCQISMDGRGAWRDNVFIERLWRTLKYEEVYLHADDSIAQARHGIDRGLNWYNAGRPHSSLSRQSPNQVKCMPRCCQRLNWQRSDGLSCANASISTTSLSRTTGW